MVVADQVRRLVGLLPGDGGVPMFVFDAGYDPAPLAHGLVDTRAQTLVRISSKRVFHPEPPPRPEGRRRRPRRHGARFALSEHATWTASDAQLTATDRRYGNISVKAWHGLHPKLPHRGRWTTDHQAPIVAGSVIRVDVEHLPKPTGRTKDPVALVVGPRHPRPRYLLARLPAPLRHRDTFRFVKSTLGWTSPALCTPTRPTAGPGSSSPPTPSSDSPAASSRTYACPGNAPATPSGSRRPESQEVFGRYVQPAPPPSHQNLEHQAQDAPKAPQAAPDPSSGDQKGRLTKPSDLIASSTTLQERHARHQRSRPTLFHGRPMDAAPTHVNTYAETDALRRNHAPATGRRALP